jgi:hypothetical protein
MLRRIESFFEKEALVCFDQKEQSDSLSRQKLETEVFARKSSTVNHHLNGIRKVFGHFGDDIAAQ